MPFVFWVWAEEHLIVFGSGWDPRKLGEIDEFLNSEFDILEVWVVEGSEEDLDGGLLLALVHPGVQEDHHQLPPGRQGPQLHVFGLGQGVGLGQSYYHETITLSVIYIQYRPTAICV